MCLCAIAEPHRTPDQTDIETLAPRQIFMYWSVIGSLLSAAGSTGGRHHAGWAVMVLDLLESVSLARQDHVHSVRQSCRRHQYSGIHGLFSIAPSACTAL